MTAHQVDFSIVEGDALSIEADVLLLKYAQHRYGLDNIVISALERLDATIDNHLPKPYEWYVADSQYISRAKKTMLVGVNELARFRYSDIRDFASSSLRALKASLPDVKHVITTVHGVNIGLDEGEALRSEVAGFLDAIETSNAPPGLERISIVEMKSGRAERLAAVLRTIFPTRVDARVRSSVQYTPELKTAGADSKSKPHIFVAMPFSDEMEDVYHYGIQRAINTAGFLCERADVSSFTGDVITWVKERISTSYLVVADLTGANPNVYLEVGYAWGAGRPTVLLVRDAQELKFDVRGQRCLVYKKIRQLEDELSGELRRLSGPAAG